MPHVVRPADPRLAWEGVVSLRSANGWVQPYRLRWSERALLEPGLLERAGFGSGARIAFTSDTRRLAGRIEPTPEMTPLDLAVDGERFATVEVEQREAFAFDGLPAGEKHLELWLPTHGSFRLRHLELDEGADVRPAPDARPPWLTYGSSITQCRQAASPLRSWPAIVAAACELNLTSLGFGGQCHLDPMVARVMRDRPAAVLSMCVGINIYGAASLSWRTFRTGIIGFAAILREGHPEAPLVVMSPIYGAQRELQKNAVGFTLPEMRAEVEGAVRALRRHGDDRVYYIDGLEVLGPDAADLLPDDLHPNAEGYERMGRNLAERFAAILAER